MAKVKGVEELNLLPQIPTKENRALKEGGIKYRLTKGVLIPGFRV
jgi:hypothetical protein